MSPCCLSTEEILGGVGEIVRRAAFAPFSIPRSHERQCGSGHRSFRGIDKAISGGAVCLIIPLMVLVRGLRLVMKPDTEQEPCAPEQHEGHEWPQPVQGLPFLTAAPRDQGEGDPEGDQHQRGGRHPPEVGWIVEARTPRLHLCGRGGRTTRAQEEAGDQEAKEGSE